MRDDKLINKVPLRGRATLALLMLLLLCWMPLVRGVRAAWNGRYQTVPDEYTHWLRAIRICSHAIARGDS